MSTAEDSSSAKSTRQSSSSAIAARGEISSAGREVERKTQESTRNDRSCPGTAGSSLARLEPMPFRTVPGWILLEGEVFAHQNVAIENTHTHTHTHAHAPKKRTQHITETHNTQNDSETSTENGAWDTRTHADTQQKPTRHPSTHARTHKVNKEIRTETSARKKTHRHGEKERKAHFPGEADEGNDCTPVQRQTLEIRPPSDPSLEEKRGGEREEVRRARQEGREQKTHVRETGW